MINFLQQMGTATEWRLAIIFSLLTVCLLALFKYLLISKFRKLALKTKNQVDDFLVTALSVIGWPLEVILAIFVGSKFLLIPADIEKFISWVTLTVVIVYAAKFLQKTIEYFSLKNIGQKEKEGNKTDASGIEVVSRIGKWAVWFIAALLILQNSGINIGTILAGAGIIGIAIAFAMQEVLSDLFACFTIYFDKPFRVGDYIVMENGKSGTVKKIGLKSTRLKSLVGEEIVVSNKKLTESVLHNYKKMDKRRITFIVGVDAKTTISKLERGKKIIEEVIDKDEDTELLRAHIKDFNGNSWEYEIAYNIVTKEYTRYLDAQERINLNIRKLFDKEKIKFATDVQKIILKK